MGLARLCSQNGKAPPGLENNLPNPEYCLRRWGRTWQVGLAVSCEMSTGQFYAAAIRAVSHAEYQEASPSCMSLA